MCPAKSFMNFFQIFAYVAIVSKPEGSRNLIVSLCVANWDFVFIIFLNACTRIQIFVKEESREAQRAKGATQGFFVIVRRTTSSYNKEHIFYAGEGTVESQMFSIDCLNLNYFCFNFSMNCEIVLTYELFHVMNIFLFISVKLPQYIWVMNVLNDNELSLCIFSYYSHVFWNMNSYL